MNNEHLKNYLNSTVLAIALQEIYIKEIEGEESNQRILKYASDLGIKEYTMDSLSWCALWVNWILFKAGACYTKYLTARSLKELPFHIREEDMIAGDVVILWRDCVDSWKSHVGIFVNWNDDNVRLIGGNQNDQVKISEYPAERILYIRRPTLHPQSNLILKHCLYCGADFYSCQCVPTML